MIESMSDWKEDDVSQQTILIQLNYQILF